MRGMTSPSSSLTRRRAGSFIATGAFAAAFGSGRLAQAQAQTPSPTRAETISDSDAALLAAAIAGEHRTAARARDGARHPLETLRFFGVASSHTVVELSPGGGWYTEILAPYLRANGRMLSAHFARDSAVEYERKGRERFEAKLAANPSLYDRVQVGTLPGPKSARSFEGLAAAGSVDRVLTFRNVHNWLDGEGFDVLLRASFDVLKPGGVLGVVEHRAAPGSTLAQAIKTGYVTEDLVIERARAAGFTAVQRSEVNANPRDTRDHARGVWSLPPTLAGKDVDRERFLAIGESDRMTLRFTKPLV